MQNGVLLILLSMSLTPLGDALSKYLGATQSPFVIVFLRYFTAGLIALILARICGAKVELPRAGRVGMVIRTALVMGAMTCLIVALSMIPLANAVGGFLIAPIVAMLMSVFIHHEALTFPRIIGAFGSFFGALLILRPDAGLAPGMLFALGGGLLLGGFLALSRYAPPAGHPISALAVQCLLGSGMILPFALPSFSGVQTAQIPTLFPAVVGLGLVTAATHFLTVAAYQRAEAARLAPFFYFNLVVAVVVGIFWFGEMPTTATLSGLTFIVFGGLFSLLPPGQAAKLLSNKIKGLARNGANLRQNIANT